MNCNCNQLKRNILISVINEICGTVSNPDARVKVNMIERVMQSTNIILNASVFVPVEERRILVWTTYDNLHIWFVD